MVSSTASLQVRLSLRVTMIVTKILTSTYFEESEGVKQTCTLHPLGLNIKHLYWNESKGNCYCRLESLKSTCRKFSFDNLKIQILRRVERIPAWELLQSFSAPQVTRSTVTNQQKTAGGVKHQMQM